MIDRSAIALHRRSLLSPIWLTLRDTFRGAPPPRRALGVVVEQRRDGQWWPLPVATQLTASGHLAFPGLGQSAQTVGRFVTLRITLTVPGTVTEDAAGHDRLIRTLVTWNADRPPPVPVAEIVRFLPGPVYEFGPDVPVVTGHVAAADGSLTDRARVSVSEVVAGTARVEEVRAGPDGGFRIPVRWSAGQAMVDAALGALAGSVIVPLPQVQPARITLT